MELRYFSNIEFNHCNPSCELEDMNPNFMKKLDNARHLCKTPFRPTSAFRSQIWELEHGRNGNSSHTKGCAIDLEVKTSAERFDIVNALLMTGFNRIGIGENFIHVDDDKSKVQNVIWDYYGS